MTSREFQEKLSRRARRAGVALEESLGNRLEIYYRLLATWNQRLNLSGLDLGDATPETLDRLLIEPLLAAAHVPTWTCQMLDIGSGGGSPSLPLVLAVPRLHLLMVESKTRKSVFLREAIRALDLAGRADVAATRFEELLARPDLHEAHDLVTVRAVRVERQVLGSLQAFLKPGGLMFLFRGPSVAEPDRITPPLVWMATHPLLESLRSQLVVLEKRQFA